MNDKLDRWIEEKLQHSASPKKMTTLSHGKSDSAKSVNKKQYKHNKPKHKRKFKPNFKQKSNRFSEKFSKNTKGIKIIPLGGFDEVGKNMLALEYGDDIMIIDMGFQFPEEDMLGIDYVIPDISYIKEKRNKIRGVICTHGHLDHIGGIPYILPELDFPQLYATKLTAGLIEKRIAEFGLQKDTMLNVFDPKETIQLGQFRCRFFRVNHSIPDGIGIIIETPEGIIVHSGDFKFDETPADQIKADIGKIAELGRINKPKILFSDSTNATKPGHTISEKTIGENLDKIIGETEGRLIIASFASLIGRIQQIMDSAHKHKRKVFLSGRSLLDNVGIADRLGFIKAPKGLIHDARHSANHPENKTLIMTTGSQGEAVSALTRISLGTHKHVKIRKGDTVVISASPIIGNERAINAVINNLTKLGARVIHNKIMDVHVSGHGAQEDLKRMINLVKPKYHVPIHGEYFMRQAHKDLAIEMGIPAANSIVINNGDVLEFKKGNLKQLKEKVDTNYVVVDGRGLGDIGSRVIMERQMLAENGVIIVTMKVNKKTKQLIGNISLEARGFIYQQESEKIKKDIKIEVRKRYGVFLQKNKAPGHQNIKQFTASVIDKYTHKKLARRPLIVTSVVEV